MDGEHLAGITFTKRKIKNPPNRQVLLFAGLRNGDAGLVHPNGTLTPLGNLYKSFAAGSNLTEINITVPEHFGSNPST